MSQEAMVKVGLDQETMDISQEAASGQLLVKASGDSPSLRESTHTCMSSSSSPTQPKEHSLKSGRPKGSVQIKEPPASEMRGYKVVQVEEKHGILHRAIPVMPLWLAILCCVFNIVLPGTGTMISAFTVFCCGNTTRMRRPIHAMALNLVAGFFQISTFLIIVGWIWSILWGMTFVQLALSNKEDTAAVLNPTGLPYYVRRHSSVE